MTTGRLLPMLEIAPPPIPTLPPVYIEPEYVIPAMPGGPKILTIDLIEGTQFGLPGGGF